MKNSFKILFFISSPLFLHSQQTTVDSLKAIMNLKRGDSTEVKALFNYSNLQLYPDSAIEYSKQGLSLAQKISYKKGEADCFFNISRFNSSNLADAIQNGLRALSIYTSLKDYSGVASSNMLLQGGYRDIGDYKSSLAHAFSGIAIAEKYNLKEKYIFPGTRIVTLLLAEISQTYLLMDQLDSAEKYAQKAINQKELFHGAEWNFPIYLLADIQNRKGNYKSALEDYRRALPLAVQNVFFRDTLQIFSGLSTLFRKMKLTDSSIYYASQVVQSTGERELKTYLEALSNLATGYKAKGIKDSALKYTEINYSLRDTLFSRAKDREIQSFVFNEKLKQQEIISDQEKYKSKIQLYVFIGGLFVLLLLAVILWRNNQLQKRAKNKIEKAYKELKTTQAQLIQSEKMASLGELTAGIAHEIQNPLNFVNNFSEVNEELLKELKTEAGKGNLEEIKAIANDISFNSEKITHHGKRADAIVKGMLQHSRTSTGQKEPTDLNALADEYLRLSYHGLRAKDKSFNATMKTDFDNSIGKINIIPQDIGRVVLNLINNAFYVVDEKKKQLQDGYDPTISVSTKKINGKVEIRVADNGNGIPQKVLDKTFQPFFTTKPTGQGTGLGLSLSYDIVKAHGGELKVETKEGEGSQFIIQLNI